MAVAVAGERGYSHARQNFAEAVVHTRAHFLEGAGFFGFCKLFGAIWNDSACAAGYQHGDMVRVKYLSAFGEQRDIGVSLAHGAFPNSRCRQQHGQRGALAADIAIGKEEEPRTLAATQRGSQTLSETAARSRDSIVGRKACINNLQLSDRCTERRKLSGAKNGAGQAMRLAERNFEEIGRAHV